MTALPANRLPRAWYDAPLPSFLTTTPDTILGALTRASGDHAVEPAQTQAWLAEIARLKSWLAPFRHGTVFLEFTIPRMGRRIDAVLLLGELVVVIEFKVGERRIERAALDQVWDYALDLKNFHEASHARPIVPILVATEASGSDLPPLLFAADGVARPIAVATDAMPSMLAHLQSLQPAVKDPAALEHDAATWTAAPYRPTPTIVEAARALYAQHSVAAIARHDAEATNLRLTAQRLESLVDEARTQRRKILCFVTGVPGAGKTLVGLNLATQRRDTDAPTHAVFLSGNGPLVAVLREALTRDDVERRKARGERITKANAGKPVKAFIQNVHHFRDEALRHPGPPADHVVIFDEAQRAWNKAKAANFMKQRKGIDGFAHSEPEFLIQYMDRHRDWAVIVCLVGGGQEIHTGEAGIAEWLQAATTHFPHWQLHVSSQLVDSEYAAGQALDLIRDRPNVHLDEESLHLYVSMRSFRAERVSAFVKALLDCDRQGAAAAYQSFKDRYPIVITRDLDKAKAWVRERARGNEQYGLLASSKAMRLKPYAIDIRVSVDPVQWFLNERSDVRSSWYLEDCATEFQVQGLELDWACVTWDGDFRAQAEGSGWSCHDFRGDRWVNIHSPENRSYLKNAYRVLLTRARQGMVVFVPPGDRSDPTRLPAHYDETWRYLEAAGIAVL
ncbi:MAG: DUF2075 domain-containing protein [Steroidobacteraceae bacterium]